jgi:hypothetical protein
LVALTAFVIALTFSIAPLIAVEILDEAPLIASALFVLSPILAVMGWHTVWSILFVRYRYNNSGLKRRTIRKRNFIVWENVQKIDRHWLLGPRLQSFKNKRFFIWKYHRGFDGFIATAKAHGITVTL